jgi:hypothetical protein
LDTLGPLLSLKPFRFWLLEDFVENFQKGQNLVGLEYCNGDESFDTYWRTLSLDMVKRSQPRGSLTDVDLDTHRRIVKEVLLEPDNMGAEAKSHSTSSLYECLYRRKMLYYHTKRFLHNGTAFNERRNVIMVCSVLMLLWLQVPRAVSGQGDGDALLRDTDSLAQRMFTGSWMARQSKCWIEGSVSKCSNWYKRRVLS